MRSNPVIQAAMGAVLAIAITGLIPPHELIRSAASGISDMVLPGPSAAERGVESLYSGVSGNPIWRSAPEMSTRSRKTLIADWEEVSPDRPRAFSGMGAKEVELEELFEDQSLDGRRIVVRAYVAQIYAKVPVEDQEELVSVSYRLGLGDERQDAWCAQAHVTRRDVPRVDQLVEVRGVVLARGSADLASGGFVNGTYLLCSSPRLIGKPGNAEAVAALFRKEEESDAWMDPPDLSSDARDLLVRAWPKLTPFEPHAFPDQKVRRVDIDQIFEDSRFDGNLLGVAGYITQRFLFPVGPGLTLQRLRLEVVGQERAIWCLATVQNWRVFHEGEYVEAVGVPFARGSADLASGGFGLRTVFVCPAMRRA